MAHTKPDAAPMAPASIVDRLRLENNCLHLSAELRGNPELDLYLACLDRCGLETCVVWHSPARFEQRFGLRPPDRHRPEAVAAPLPQSWVDEYVRALFVRAMQRKASDIHITYMGPYAQVSFRRMGLMTEEECLDGPLGLQLIRGIFQGHLSQAESGFSEYERYDGRIADRSILPDGLFAVRLHTEPIQSPLIPHPGLVLAMRLLFDATSATGSLEERLASLGFTAEQRDTLRSFCETTGMTVVSGPTGHGKTTVLKNIMEALASEAPTRSYYSLEDPPEYTILGVRQLNVFTKAASEEARGRALVEALAGLMRSDPDVILLGEVRYREAAEAAINAALTGHAVWTTTHAGSALAIITRFHEMGLPLASVCSDNVLAGLTYQRLLPVLCPDCSLSLAGHEDSLPKALLRRLERCYPHGETAAVRLRGHGCPHCGGIGLVGQRVAAEVIPLRDARLRALLRAGRHSEAVRYWRLEMDGKSHLDHARARVAGGEVDPVLCEERLGATLDADLEVPEAPVVYAAGTAAAEETFLSGLCLAESARHRELQHEEETVPVPATEAGRQSGKMAQNAAPDEIAPDGEEAADEIVRRRTGETQTEPRTRRSAPVSAKRRGATQKTNTEEKSMQTTSTTTSATTAAGKPAAKKTRTSAAAKAKTTGQRTRKTTSSEPALRTTEPVTRQADARMNEAAASGDRK